jgi:hypothetical protein
MTLFAYLDGTQVAVSSIRLTANGNQSIVAATGANGQLQQGSVALDDPSGALSVQGWQKLIVDEPDCTTAPHLLWGYTADQTYQRGPYLTSAGRTIDVTVNDPNVLLTMGLFGQGSANRPSETDGARIAWLLAQTQIAGQITDHGLVNASGATLDATNYANLGPADVLNDAANATGRIFFVYIDQATNTLGLYYDTPIATAFTSTLTLSNVLSDISFDSHGEPTGTCLPCYSATMASNPSSIYCELLFIYAGNQRLIAHNQTTHDTYFSHFPAGVHRAIQVQNARVGKATTAQSYATRYLEHYSVEERNVRGTYRVKSSQVGLVQPGHRIGMRFTHLPALSTQQYYRIETLAIAPTDGDNTHYDVTFDASVHGLDTPRSSPGGGDTGSTPQPPVSSASFVQGNSGNNGTFGLRASLTTTPSSGDLLILSASLREVDFNGGSSLADVTDAQGKVWHVAINVAKQLGPSGGTDGMVLLYRVSDGTEILTDLSAYTASHETTYHYSEWGPSGSWGSTIPGVANSSGWTTSGTASQAVSSPTIAVASVIYGHVMINTGGGGTQSMTAGAGYTKVAADQNCPSGHPFGGAEYELVDSAAASYTPSATFSSNPWKMMAAIFQPGTDTSNPPQHGTPIGPELVVMSGINGTTKWPFTQGSLRVWYDTIDQTTAIVSSDGPSGTFVMPSAPPLGTQVFVYYQGI